LQAITDYQALFLNDTPILDVRAPVEYEKGAFPASENHPLMDDEQRKLVGTRYKTHGQEAAIDLGNALVSGEVKDARINAWVDFFRRHPHGVLYCFRGGLRSRVTQQWLAEAGIDKPYIQGGYKAMRGYLLEQLHQRIADGNTLILSGATGSGKTDVIAQWPHSVDLEGLAKHRGSAFGKTETEQPPQIGFENAWSVDWLKRHQQSRAPVLFEDESRLIGRIAIVPEFLAMSKHSDIVLLNAPLEERIARIRKDYFERAYISQLPQGEEQAQNYLDDFVRSALTRIQKRLGGERYQQLCKCLDEGLTTLRNQNSWQPFDTIVETLLIDYYDPMYNYQFEAKAHHKVFEGTHQEILQWLSDKHPA